MNKELWENYQKQLDLNLGELNIDYELSKNHNEKKDLNRTWALLNQVIMKAAYKKIPSETKKKLNKSGRPKLLLNTLSLAKYIIRVTLKVNKMLKGKISYDTIDWIKIKEKIINIKKKHELTFDEECIGRPLNNLDLIS